MKVSAIVLSLFATVGLVSAGTNGKHDPMTGIPWGPGKRAVGGITSLPRRWMESFQVREAEEPANEVRDFVETIKVD